MAKKHRERTLRQIILSACFFLFILPLLLVWLLLIWTTSQTVKQNVMQEQQKITQLTGIMVNGKLMQVDQTIQRARMDARVQEILREVDFQDYNSSLVEAYRDLTSFSDLLKTQSGGELDNVIFCNNQGDLYYNSFVSSKDREMIRSEWVQEAQASPGKAVLIDTEMKNKSGEPLVTVGQMIVDIDRLEFVGAVFLCYKQSAFENLLGTGDAVHNGTFLVVGDDVIASHELPDDIRAFAGEGRQFENGRQIAGTHDAFYFSIFQCSLIPMQVVRYFSYSGVMDQLCLEQITIILVVLAAIFFFGMYFLYINRKIYRPLQKITKTSMDFSDCYELNQISDTILSLTRKNQDGQEEIVRLIDKCKTTTLDKLQAQINPHFLYNTLSTVKYIAILNGQEKISQLISSLVKLLRSVVGREGDLIALKDEIENVRHYMMIQNAAYEKNIEFEISLLEKDEKWLVPNFILQPLVENCIFHGIHPNQPGGKIQISAYQEKQSLQIEVSDNGDGFQDEKLINILESSGSQNHFTNLGIKAIHQKIQLLCGPEYGLKIFSKKGVGTTIVISLPLKEGVS